MKSEALQVAVIGAGAAGLCAARHLSKHEDRINFTVFEQEEDVGGTWRYTDQIGKNEYGIPIHSSMYKYMKTNLPKEAMAFPDFPFTNSEDSFLHHTLILAYLEKYAEHFKLYRYIKFHTLVDQVRPKKVLDRETQWDIKFHNIISGKEEQMVFDYVMVCNGRFAFPNVPSIVGLNDFKGKVIHSHEYRDNTPFRDMKVIVLGAGPSGTDITLELSQVATQVVLCHNLTHFLPSKLPSNVQQDAGIESIQERGVKLRNGNFYEAEAIVFCTGYHIKFPFLHPECRVHIEEERVTPFYRHIIHIDYPSLSVFNLLFIILPFPVFHQQVQFVLGCILGKVKLPTIEKMKREMKYEFQRRRELGMPIRHSHKMTRPLLWEYDDLISREGEFPPIPKDVRNLFEEAIIQGRKNLMTFKQMKVVRRNNEYAMVKC